MDTIDTILIGILTLVALVFIGGYVSGPSRRREENAADAVTGLVAVLVKIFPVLLVLILLFILFII